MRCDAIRVEPIDGGNVHLTLSLLLSERSARANRSALWRRAGPMPSKLGSGLTTMLLHAARGRTTPWQRRRCDTRVDGRAAAASRISALSQVSTAGGLAGEWKDHA